MICSGALLLEHLGEPKAASLIVKAIQATTLSGILTPDLGGNASTAQVGDGIVIALQRVAKQSQD
jgi:tartrate dehydrogenase/decarboxylase/D-malate dehydrogenase